MAEEDETFEDEIDPRIKGELDTLNQSTDEINSLETELIDCRQTFKSTLETATQQLQKLSKKNAKAIERARPYYATKSELAKSQLALHRAVSKYQSANGVYRAAKETIALAESGLSESGDKKVDMAWQEMLNEQTKRFAEAERERTKSAQIHERATKKFEYLENKLQTLKKKHKNSTNKTKPYFELKEMLETDLQKKKQKVDELQRKVEAAKRRYRQSLDNLEKISSEIHESRRKSTMKLIEDNKMNEKSNDTIDGPTSNPLDLDLVGLATYDNIEELEAELDDFDIDDEEVLTSGSESEDDSDSSTPSTDKKKHQLKRSNTAPAKRFQEAGIVRRKPNRISQKARPHLIQRATSVVTPSEYNRKSEDSGDDKDHDDVFSPGSSIGTIQEDASEDVNEAQEDDSTYKRLHGTNIAQEKRQKPPLPPKPKKPPVAPEDFDIFDDLCR